MKDFSEFENSVISDLHEINKSAGLLVSEMEKSKSFSSDLEKNAWKLKTHSSLEAIQILKKYHEWLNS